MHVRAAGDLPSSSTSPKNGHRIRRLRTLSRAIAWRLELETGEVRSRADIACREGISRAAVTQIMHALDRLEGDESLHDVAESDVGSVDAGFGREGYRKRSKEVLRRFEIDYVSRALRAADGSVSAAARFAQIDRKHFWRLMRRTGVGEARPSTRKTAVSPARRTERAGAPNAIVTRTFSGPAAPRGRWLGLIIEEQKETVLRAAAVLPPGFRKGDVMRRSQSAINLSRALAALVGEGKLRREGDRNRSRYWLAEPPAVRFPAL